MSTSTKNPGKARLGDLAESVLAEVNKEQLAKTAALAHTSKASVKSSLSQLMVKTAEAVRVEAANQGISYDDLARFRKKYDV